MPLSNKEKQRRFKEKLKLDPEKYNEYKRKKTENYHAKKRLVKDLDAKEKYNARIIWRLRKKSQRDRKKNLDRIIHNTPPSSPSIGENEPNYDLRDVMQNQRSDSPAMSHSSSVSQKESGRKKVKRDRSKLYRENCNLKKQNEELKQKYEKYKKRYQRSEKKKTEKSKVNLRNDVGKKYGILSNVIKEKYISLKKRRDKNTFKSAFEHIQDAEKVNIAKEALGLKGRLRSTISVRNSKPKINESVREFFLRDDISRATAGRKETKTKGNVKMQKRYLLDTVKSLFQTFKKENPDTRCSYSYFSKSRPFYVVKPSVSGREMCLCKKHINPTYKALELKKKGIIVDDNLDHLISATVCDPQRQACMYATCQDCCKKEIGHDTTKNSMIMTWQEWGRKEISYEKDGRTHKAVKNIKETKEGTVEDLMKTFNQELKIVKKHIYNIKVQFKNFRQAVDKLEKTEVVIVADFSENYDGKHHEEVQAHHFGGSRQQISLHTVVAYVLDDENKPQAKSYCTISSCTNHQPAAIWAHLDPVLKDILTSYPLVNTVHFYTDGPFSQYRQKQNFYLASTKTFDYGFTAVTWSFFEAGHGKGPADGVGGYLKRTADNIVAAGKDIANVEQFYDALKDTSKIKLYIISQNNIDIVTKSLPPKIKPLVGTLSVHQIFTKRREELKYRSLGCFCSRGFCDCLDVKLYHPTNMRNEDPCDNLSSSSDDNEPLSVLTNLNLNTPLGDEEINVSHLCQPRTKSTYGTIYGSEDEQEPCSSVPSGSGAEQHMAYSQGDYLLVNVRNLKGKVYRYICVIDELDDDGEIRVTFLRCVKGAKTFRLDKNDVAYINHEDIIKNLPQPKRFLKRGQHYFEFNETIEVYEM